MHHAKTQSCKFTCSQAVSFSRRLRGFALPMIFPGFRRSHGDVVRDRTFLVGRSPAGRRCPGREPGIQLEDDFPGLAATGRIGVLAVGNPKPGSLLSQTSVRRPLGAGGQTFEVAVSDQAAVGHRGNSRVLGYTWATNLMRTPTNV